MDPMRTELHRQCLTLAAIQVHQAPAPQPRSVVHNTQPIPVQAGGRPRARLTALLTPGIVMLGLVALLLLVGLLPFWAYVLIQLGLLF